MHAPGVESNKKWWVESSRKWWAARNFRFWWQHSYHRTDAPIVVLFMHQFSARGNRDVGLYVDGVDIYVDIAYIRPCTWRIPCNRAVKWVSLGVVVPRQIGKWDCLGHMVSYIYCLDICMYVIFLGLDACTGASVKICIIGNHICLLKQLVSIISNPINNHGLWNVSFPFF